VSAADGRNVEHSITELAKLLAERQVGKEWSTMSYIGPTVSSPPGPNPTIASYNASVVNFYNATGSLLRSWDRISSGYSGAA
jgi:hypothetical protein